MAGRSLAPPSPTAWRLAPLVIASSFLLCACTEKDDGCVLESRQDRTYVLRCPDGSSSTFIEPEFPDAPAVVRGSAHRLGSSDHAGIEVTLQPTAENGVTHHTLTDKDGNYVFDDVVPATYHVVLRHPSYPDVVLWQRTALPGTLVLSPVVMRPTVRIAEVEAQELIVSPNDDALLIFEEEAGRLFYWDESTGSEAIPIGQKSARPTWLPSGRVLFLEAYDLGSSSGSLVRYDPSRGTTEVLLRDVMEWMVSEDETVVIARQKNGALSAWSDDEVDVILGSGLTTWNFHPKSKLAAAIFHGPHTGRAEILVWDTVARKASRLGRADSILTEFDAAGDFLLYREPGGYALWDRVRQKPERIASGPMGTAQFDPAGRFVVIVGSGTASGSLLAYDLASGRLETVATETAQSGFDPRTGDLWIFHGTPRRLSLVRDGLSTIEIQRWEDSAFLSHVYFPRGRDEILYVVRESPTQRSLWSWAPSRPSPRRIDSGLDGDPVLVVDDAYLVYQTEVPRLLELATEEIVDLPSGGAVRFHVGHHASGLFHHPLAPLYRADTTFTVGPLTIHDLRAKSEFVIVDEIWHQSCEFSASGELLCLNRRSPQSPFGAQLVHWDREASLLRRVADGVLGFTFDRSGQRAFFWSQAKEDEEAPLLWLWDRRLDGPVAIDEGLVRAAITSDWLAYQIAHGGRSGVYVSLYPRPPVGNAP